MRRSWPTWPRSRPTTTQLRTDLNTLVPTLKTRLRGDPDGGTITNSTTVQAAETTFKADLTAAQATIQADFTAIMAATTKATRQAAFAQLQTDATAAGAILKADETAIQSAIMTDPAVTAARAKLADDEAPIVADEATLNADYTRFAADLKAEYGGKH